MKNRRIAGWVTVTGPPLAIWPMKRGMTLPLLPRTLPKRTVQKNVPLVCARACRMSSATRLAGTG